MIQGRGKSKKTIMRRSADPISQKIGRRTTMGAGLLISSRVVSRLVDLAALTVLARLLSPADFGLVAIAMQRLIEEKKLVAYRHEGFWACMDTSKEKIMLDDMVNSGEAKWQVWPIRGCKGIGIGIIAGSGL
jgi:hypothetical protein